jgi:5,6-dimethylbenzimidazole synthase/cob(I)alamin adenosyltransferase
VNHAFPAAWRRGVYEAIARRRDMRSFRPDPIPEATLGRILAAAHQAGSVGFMQPWNFVVVQDPEIRRAIRAHVEAERLRAAEAFEPGRRAQYLSYKLEGILDAPLNLCVTCDRQRFGPAVIGRHTIRDTDLYSTCAAVQNLWLAARAEGIGVGWVSILEPDELRRILDIPPHVVPVAYLCMGTVDEFPERPLLETTGWLPKLPLREVVYFDRWGRTPPPDLRGALGAPDEPPPPVPDTPSRNRDGMLMVYTGHGKGKTTAALGLVFRALGRGLQVAVVQFIKGKWKTGERLFAGTLPGLTFLVMGEGFTWESDDISRDRRAAQQAWARSKELIEAGAHDLVILDEVTYALSYGFVPVEEVVATMRARPAHVHVVLTGRNAPEELCALADLVTEMQAVKHPFEQGRKAQPGIDF